MVFMLIVWPEGANFVELHLQPSQTYTLTLHMNVKAPLKLSATDIILVKCHQKLNSWTCGYFWLQDVREKTPDKTFCGIEWSFDYEISVLKAGFIELVCILLKM